MSTWRSGWRSAFQSTLPVWGATSHIPYQLEHFPISIHAPRVGSDAPCPPGRSTPGGNFNPRSPCGERRLEIRDNQVTELFQSTLPVWGATPERVGERGGGDAISIHAPRVGSDAQDRPGDGGGAQDFNPRSPCGERRRIRGGRNIPCQIFQSTLPVWGATEAGGDHPDGHGISIHAPRVGSDSSPRLTCSRRRNFNPRSPCGERHVPVELWMQRVGISIHAPRVGSDSGSPTTASPSNNFNPRSPCGERPGGIPPHG